MSFLFSSNSSSNYIYDYEQTKRTEDFLEAALNAEGQAKKTPSSLCYSDTIQSSISWISQDNTRGFLPLIPPPVGLQKTKKISKRTPLKLPPIQAVLEKTRKKIIPFSKILQNIVIDETMPIEIREGALNNPLCPASVIQSTIKQSSHQSLRSAAVKSRNCPADLIQSILLSEKNLQILDSAVSNIKIMSTFLEATAYGRMFTLPKNKNGFNSTVRITALRNPSCPIRVSEAIWNSKAPPHIRAAALESILHFPPLELKKLVNGRQPPCIRAAALKHPRCPPSTVRAIALSEEESEFIRSAATANKNCLPKLLEFLYQSSLSRKIHMTAAGNRNCPPSIVRNAAKSHPDPLVQATALLNIKCPDSIRKNLLFTQSAPTIVRAAAAEALGMK